MGYFSTSVLRKIDEKKAFFLSRLPASISVYDENGRKLDFTKIGAFMSANGIKIMEKQVWIGESKLPVRLMIGLVPPKVYQQRVWRGDTSLLKMMKTNLKTKRRTGKIICWKIKIRHNNK